MILIVLSVHLFKNVGSKAGTALLLNLVGLLNWENTYISVSWKKCKDHIIHKKYLIINVDNESTDKNCAYDDSD